jgi:YesN/AraC family two-component response regulator
MESLSDATPSIALLIVEDEELTKELLASMLARKFPHIALHRASNGRTGLELFTTHLPEMGGFQLAVKIRAVNPDTKLIVLTGYSEEAVMRDSVAQEFKIDHIINKPIVFKELFAAIEQCRAEIGKKSDN